jgi:Transposase
VVVDHDSGRLVWAAPGREKATLQRFFDALGEQRCTQITHVSADGADWISAVVAGRCPNAVRCADPFHIVKWATEALDDVRRQAWNAARSRPGGRADRIRWSRGRIRQDAAGTAKALKHSRFALWKNPENLTTRQQAKLAWIAETNPTLHRAYLLKEGLRLVFQLDYPEAVQALEAWIGWARRCRIPTFIDLQRRISKHKASIFAAIEHGLSNGRIESVNTKIRLTTRVAFGPKSPDRPHSPWPCSTSAATDPSSQAGNDHGSVRRAVFSAPLCQERGFGTCECASALVAVNVVRPVGRSTLTAPARRRGGWGAEAAWGFAGVVVAGSSALPTSTAATRAMTSSSSTDSANIASHLPPRVANLNHVTARGDQQDKEQNLVLVLDHSGRQQ